ncbi:TIGR03620 family F420-dependent LLM class oxidoreductase [Gordonia sp. zg691]|uniref:TIGR03620 family F420-dependent LLM class oxidoreductase n=1 Tax=Gordonia jinghuaiqii TaxID=2758710 RepID=UPI0016628A3E|nr:TIGR03620 family F420-dependent LLM class oxidoreductase [Gordonia jinghuaiqii]MBD0859793.1 TIGR03620 family F420-dependent LLM class oxidoreductase [Gordonia jinghuaiqii]
MDALLPGTTGVFTSLARLRATDILETACNAEDSGFDALWVADVRGDLSFLSECLRATSHLTVATAVLSIWDLPAAAAAAAIADADADADPGRAILGLGVSHPGLVRAGTYRTPIRAINEYLDALDDARCPRTQRILGANGPRMLATAAQRGAGAVTQLVTPDRTRRQREWMGEGSLAAEVKVVLGGDRAHVRRLGRMNLAHYLELPSYRRNLADQGFTDDDLAHGGSDRLVDALVAGPDDEAIARRVREHRLAGADHVCIHVLTDTGGAPTEQWRAVGAILGTNVTEEAR